MGVNCGRANAHVNGMNLREIDRLEKENAALKAEMVGKVLVDVEKLRELEWYYTGMEYEVRECCFVCDSNRGEGHDDDCWLGNKLKEAP